MTWIRSAAPLALIALVGCGSEEDRVPLLPVVGVARMNGKPLANASVVFVPDPGNAYSTPGSAASGPDGSYKLSWRNREGVSLGKYKAIVTESLTAENLPPGIDPYMAKLAADSGKSAAKKQAEPTRNEFPVEVTATVTTFDLDVK